MDEHQPFKLGKRDRYPTGPPIKIKMEIITIIWFIGTILALLLGASLIAHLGWYFQEEQKLGKISQQNKVTFKAFCTYVVVGFSLLWPITILVFLTASLFWEEPKKEKI